MQDDFLADFLGNKYRSRLLRIFAFNPEETFSLTAARKRSAIPTRILERELRALEKLGIVKRGRAIPTAQKDRRGKKLKEPTWLFNPNMKHAVAISKFVYEVSPSHYNKVVAHLRKSSRPTAVILSGCFVGDPTRPTDLIVAADSFNESRLEQAVRRLEPLYGRELRYAAFTTPEFRYRLTIQDRLIRDTLDYPHLVLLDKTRLL